MMAVIARADGINAAGATEVSVRRAPPAARLSQTEIDVPACRRKVGRLPTTPRDVRSGGEGRRRGAGQRRGRARVARQRAARGHLSRAQGASASRGSSGVAAQTTTEVFLVE